MGRSMKKANDPKGWATKHHPKRVMRSTPYVDMKRNEEWRLTEDEKVMVSNLGRVKRNGKLVKLSPDKDGYLVTTILGKKQKVHRLVAKAFLENPDNLPVIDHKDGDKLNNAAHNLRWCTVSQNTQWAYDQGLIQATGQTYVILALDVKTGAADVYRSQSELARALNIKPNQVSSCINKYNKTCHGYLFFKIKDINFKDTLGNEYSGATADGGVWAERDEGGIRLKVVDNRDNPMTQDSCMKTVDRLYEQIVGER